MSKNHRKIIIEHEIASSFWAVTSSLLSHWLFDFWHNLQFFDASVKGRNEIYKKKFSPPDSSLDGIEKKKERATFSGYFISSLYIFFNFHNLT